MAVTIIPAPMIHDTAEIGRNTQVWPFASVGAYTKFGANGVIGSCVYIGKDVVAGDDVRIQHGAFIPNGTIIGDRVFIGPNASLCDDKYPRVNNPGYDAKPPILEHDCNIGAGAIILPGVTVHAGCTVPAGAIVTKDFHG